MKLKTPVMKRLYEDLAIMDNNLDLLADRIENEEALQEFREASDKYRELVCRLKASISAELHSRRLGG